MTIHLNVKRVKKGLDYLFIDDLSKDCYDTALFRLHFKHDGLTREHSEIIEEYLQNSFNNLVEILNGEDTESENNGSHEDRIKSLEDEIFYQMVVCRDAALRSRCGTCRTS